MDQRWHVAQFSGGQEVSAADRLGSRGFTPKRIDRWVARGKQREAIRGAYGGIVFVDQDITDPYVWEHVANLPGFVRFIPGAPLNYQRMQEERSKVDAAGIYQETKPFQRVKTYRPGTILAVTSGAFAGHTGICIWSNKKYTNLSLTPLQALGGNLSIETERCAPASNAVNQQHSTPNVKRGPHGHPRSLRRTKKPKRF